MSSALKRRIERLEKAKSAPLNIIKLVEANGEAGLSADEILARRDIERPPNALVIVSRYCAEGRSGPEFVEGGQNVYVQFPPKLAGFFEPVPETSEMAKEWQQNDVAP
ncbi:MAG: hypothetical protein AAGA21_11710 [Pseudomonadota bacterium]